MRGFKSSGPRPVAVNFEKGFTVITGPNGSGKSNIADAIMFAIGENSPKQLRAANGKLTGLIFDPGENAGPGIEKPNACRVTLQLDNSDRAVPVDADTVTITRELRDDGENTYYLNGKKTTRSGLTEILDLAGLAAGGLNMVPQGAANRVADLSPEDKRRLIEDVVGIAKFDERKTEAQKQLGQADQRLEVAMARVGEMKGMLESLETQRNDMIRFNLLESQINWLRAVQTARKIGEQRERLSSLRAQEQQLNGKLSELNARLTDYENRITQVESEKNKFITDVVQGGGSSQLEIQFQLTDVRNELDGLEAGMKEAQENVRVLEQEQIPQLREVVALKQKEVNVSNAEVKRLGSDLQRLDEKHAELRRRLDEIFSASETLRGTIEKKRKGVARAQERIAQLKDKLSEVDGAANQNNASLGVERKRLEELKGRVGSTSSVLQQFEKSVKELSDQYEGSTQELEKIETDISGSSQRRARLIASIEEASRILEKATGEVAKEEAFRQVSESLAGERLGQTKLQDLCENGGVPGYLGRLSQLVGYQPIYSKAINAVMGRWMGSFVVEDLRSMTQLIKAAKTLEAKIYSVIPLSEVEACKSVEVEKSAGVVGPLVDVLGYDKAYSGLVNFLPGDTVLVESEAVGYMMSSEGVRAVTLDGETFEAGGRAFTFGYQEVLMNLMEGLVNIEGMSEIEDAVGALKGAISKRKSELQSVESESNSLSKERVKKTVSVSGLRAEVATYNRVAARYRSNFRALNVEYQKQGREVEKIEQKIKALAEQRASMVNAVSAQQQLITDVQSLELEAMLAELEGSKQSLTAEIDSLRNKMSEVNFNLSRERANLENILTRALSENELDLKAAMDDLNGNAEYVRDQPKRIKELTEQRRSLEEQIQKLLESSKRSQPVLDEFDAKIRRLKEERDSLSRSVAANQKEAFALGSQVESTQERVAEFLGSLQMMGYTEEPEVFENSDSLLSSLDTEYKEIVSSVNRGADRQYTEMYENYKSLSVRNNDLEKERNAIIAFIESVEGEKRKVFIAAFENVGKEFSAIFGRLTEGQAWLELEKPDEIFSGGLLLRAKFGSKPPRESMSLSGGEKAISGVSLILAMQKVQPHPFYMFDEIDAALDAVNSGNLAEFLKERSAEAQIVGITLRDVFVAQSNITYGVYNAGGVSRVVHYKPAEVQR
ncbi:MAG: chromosome segregation protein SMC [Nitrososphaerota archaeon]|nr:chromosome segregation protein SMC [Nitrososphaerota archaeon]